MARRPDNAHSTLAERPEQPKLAADHGVGSQLHHG
jgi:hypothetical protein